MVAKALSMSPGGGTFKGITGSAMAYGLTDGAAQGEAIGLTDLGRRAVAPTAEGDDRQAQREAVLRPRIVREFLERYDNARVPSRNIALNVLEEMGVPSERAERALDTIMENASEVGFLELIGDQSYVNLDGTGPITGPTLAPSVDVEDEGDQPITASVLPEKVLPHTAPAEVPAANDLAHNKRVFISHGKNRGIVDQLKEVLTFGGFEPIVSVDKEAVAKPVPEKVMDDMRSCGAGIVHVGNEKTLLDGEGAEHKVLNPNVLIEIGAALALYKRNFILLVEQGVEVPSNLQGLYQVRYEGDKLDYDATMKLLRAFNDFKTSSLPD